MRPLLTQTMAILLLVASMGAAQRPTKEHHKSKATSSRHAAHQKAYQVGKASWYGKDFHGKKTASGEPYNMFQFTAAHPQLPLGTYLKVTNLKNGLWVIVRVNDRGPVPQGRIIDLSYGAAQMLGLRSTGVERVRLDVVNPQTIAALSPPPAIPDSMGVD